MRDYISRQAAIDVIKKHYRAYDNDLLELIAFYIEELPPAQPEIICCKDCDWWTKQEDSLQGRCELMQMYPTGSWFCANAKRRQDDPTD